MEETRRRTFLNWASRISHVKRVDHHALLLLPDYYMAKTTWQRLFREEWSRLFPRNLLRSDYTIQTLGSYVARNQGTRGRCEEAEGREGKGREEKGILPKSEIEGEFERQTRGRRPRSMGELTDAHAQLWDIFVPTR